MKTEFVNVTPAIAATWLSQNQNNRPIRRGVVEGLKSAFLRGEYITTHQGVAFSEDGELLDGQHRLTAISELRDGMFPMLVTRGLVGNAFQAMDTGLKRTASDSLRMDDRRVVEVARLIAVICTARRGSVTPLLLIPIIEEIECVHSGLMSFCPTSAKAWSAAPVRLGAVASILSGEDSDYVKTTYRALVLTNFDAMPPVARALYKSYLSGVVRASDTADMLSRAMVVFNARKAQNTRVQINDNKDSSEKIRSLFGHLIADEIGAEKKKAAPGGAAKSVSPAHSIGRIVSRATATQGARAR